MSATEHWFNGDLHTIAILLARNGPEDGEYYTALREIHEFLHMGSSHLWGRADLLNVCGTLSRARVLRRGRHALPFVVAMYHFCLAVGCEELAGRPGALLRQSSPLPPGRSRRG